MIAPANRVLPSGLLTVSATVTGLTDPIAGATMTFDVYSHYDVDCSSTPMFTSVKTVTLAGTMATATSDAFMGTYRYGNSLIVTYGDDANNPSVSTICRRLDTAPDPPPQMFARAFAERVTAATSPRHDRLAPHAFTTTGRIVLRARTCAPKVKPAPGAANCIPHAGLCPPGEADQDFCTRLDRTQLCTGSVTVRLQRRGITVSSRTVAVKADCSYRSRVSFHGRAGALTVRARFKGNKILSPMSSIRHTVRSG